jgi:hypothetical protein
MEYVSLQLLRPTDSSIHGTVREICITDIGRRSDCARCLQLSASRAPPMPGVHAPLTQTAPMRRLSHLHCIELKVWQNRITGPSLAGRLDAATGSPQPTHRLVGARGVHQWQSAPTMHCANAKAARAAALRRARCAERPVASLKDDQPRARPVRREQ